ncbi:MAG TPA: MBL fold metallo-hydrolase [Eubacteriaceae bacterium]|nr:MBL fold metallo-hydrolase [Eubacteriaceae bacterium]
MRTKQIAQGIHMLSMNVEDILFEGIWSIANGVTLNSYVIKGEKTALVDGVIGWEGPIEDLYKVLKEIDVDPAKIDYVIVNHMEPDHSGWMDDFKKINPNFQIVCSQKASDLLKAFFDISEKVHVVKDGETLDLGKGKELSFHLAPNVHWPDTMMTFDEQTKTLLTCDMYGAFGKIEEHFFDDELTEEEKEMFEDEGIRYFSNVMGTFSTMAKRAIDKTEKLDISIIAPGHGPVYRKDPQKIIDDYKRYCEYSKGQGKNEISILWGSMYGMTERVVNEIIKTIEDEGIAVNSLQMPAVVSSDMVSAIFRSAGVIIAAPTYEYRLFPPVAVALDEIGRKKITGKAAFCFGSYGWSGGAQKEIMEIVAKYKPKWDFVEPVEFNGRASQEEMDTIQKGVKELIAKVKEARK